MGELRADRGVHASGVRMRPGEAVEESLLRNSSLEAEPSTAALSHQVYHDLIHQSAPGEAFDRVASHPESREILFELAASELIGQALITKLRSQNDTRSNALLHVDCQVALLGLMDTFKSDKGHSFISYAKKYLFYRAVDQWREDAPAYRRYVIQRKKVAQLDENSGIVEGSDEHRLFVQESPQHQDLQRRQAFLRAQGIGRDEDESSPFAELAVEVPDPSYQMETAEAFQRLVFGLPSRLRALMQMRILDGSTYQELGSERDMSESRVCQIIREDLGDIEERFQAALDPAEKRFAVSIREGFDLRRSAELARIDPSEARRAYGRILEKLEKVLAPPQAIEVVTSLEPQSLAKWKGPGYERFRTFLGSDVHALTNGRVQFSDWIDGPGFIQAFLSDSRQPVSQMKPLLCAKLIGEARLSSAARLALMRFISHHYQDLDDIISGQYPSRPLCTLFGTDHGAEYLASALVSHGFFDRELPNGHNERVRYASSQYFKSTVVGVVAASENLKKYIRSRLRTLDDFGTDKDTRSLSHILGCKADKLSVAKALVSGGIFSGLIPAGAEDALLQRGHDQSFSFYFLPEVVGRELAERNFRIFVNSTCPGLDQISERWSHKIGLRLGVKTRGALAQALASPYGDDTTPLLTSEIPEEQIDWMKGIAIGSRPSYYFDASVVGKEKAKNNLARYFARKFPTLDHIEFDASLCSLLGCDPFMVPMAKALVAQGYFSPERPIDQPLKWKTRGFSFYQNPEVVGEEQAERNFDSFLQEAYPNLDYVRHSKPVGERLGCGASPARICRALIARGTHSGELPSDSDPSSVLFSSAYFQPGCVGETLADSNLKRLIQSKYPHLDAVFANEALAKKLGVSTRVEMIQAMIERGFLSPTLPEDYHPAHLILTTGYFQPQVVGKKHAENNLNAFLRKEFETLDSVPGPGGSRKSLQTLLGVESQFALGRALVERKTHSALLPEGYRPDRIPQSYYFKAEVVGESAARQNLCAFLGERFENLDAVHTDPPVALLLGVEPRDIPKALMALGTHSPLLPEGHRPKAGLGRSVYFDAAVVGEAAMNTNLHSVVREKWNHLDEVVAKDMSGLSTCLGVSTQREVQAALVTRGIFSATPPKDYEPKSVRSTSFFDPQVVGEDAASENINHYLIKRFQNLDSVGRDVGLAQMLGVQGSDGVLKALISRGTHSVFLPDDYRPHGMIGTSVYLRSEIVGEEAARINLQSLISEKYTTLDDVRYDPGLATALGVPPTGLVQTLVQRGLVPSELPKDYRPVKTVGSSLYFNPKVVGADAARRNLGILLSERYANLDELRGGIVKSLERCLGVGSRTEVQRVLVEWQIYSPVLPDDYRPGSVLTSAYYRADIVGTAAARHNLDAYLKDKFATLDAVHRSEGLIGILGVSDLDGILRALVHRGTHSATFPPDYRPTTKVGLSPYFRADIVGEEVALANLEIFVQERYSNLDEIGFDEPLATILGVPTAGVTRALVQRGLLSDIPPKNHPPADRIGLTAYFRAEGVGREAAERNFLEYLGRNFSGAGDIGPNEVAHTVRLFGLPRNRAMVIQFLESRGVWQG